MPGEVGLFLCYLVYWWIVGGARRGRVVFMLFGLRVDCWACQER